MSEEQLSTPEAASTEAVEPSTGEAPAAEALEAQVTNGDSTTVESEAPTPALDETTIREQVKAELEAEYSKRLSGLQSEKDKQIAELRRQNQAASAAKFAQAQQVAAENPQQAWDIANQEWGNIQQQQQIEASHQQWAGYLTQRMEAEGLDVGDAEAQALLNGAVTQLAQQAVLDPVNAASAAMGLRDQLTDLALSRKDETHKAEIKAAETRATEAAMAKMDELLETKLAQALENAGIAPDTSTGVTPAAPSDEVDYTAMSSGQRKAAVKKLRMEEMKKLIPST